MYIYIAAELLMFVFVFLCYKATNKVSNVLLFICCVVWALIFGLRGYNVGNDTPAYAGFFSGRNVYSGYGTYDNPEESIEWGYITLNKILSIFSDSATFLFLVHSCLLFFLIYKLFQHNKNSVMSLLWLLCFGSMLTVMMVALRQSFSVCFLLLSILMFEKIPNGRKLKDTIRDRNFLLAVCFFVFAITIHRSSILFFPILIVLAFLKFKKLGVYMVLTATLVIAFIFSDFLSELFDMGMFMVGGVEDDKVSLLAERYKDDMGNAGASFANIISLSVPVFLTTYLSSEEEVNSLSFKCLIVSMVVYLLFSSSPIISRFILAFIILGYRVIIPRAINKEPRLFLFYLMVTAYYLWRSIDRFLQDALSQNNTYIFYKFFWE